MSPALENYRNNRLHEFKVNPSKPGLQPPANVYRTPKVNLDGDSAGLSGLSKNYGLSRNFTTKKNKSLCLPKRSLNLRNAK